MLKLFTPRAPELSPDTAPLRYHFPSDYQNPDGSYKAGPAPVELRAALARVQYELQTLRATIDAAKGTRPAARLHAEVAQARVRIETAATERDRMQAQARAGLITVAECASYVAKWNGEVDRFRALTTELQQREQADAAAAELQRITEALQ